MSYNDQEIYKKLAIIFHNSNDAIIILNAKGKILLWNKGAEDIYGYKEKQAVGMDILKIIPKSKIKEAVDFVKKLSQGKFVKPFETERITKDGKIVETVLTSSVVRIGKEKLISIITTERDITEKKKGIKDLIESEIKLKDVTKNLKEAIFSKDLNRKYIFVNPFAVQMIGLAKSKIIGKTAEQIFDKKSAKIIRDLDERNFEGEDVNIVRKLNIGEKEFYLNTVQSPVKDKNGKIVGIAGIVRDVTIEKGQENELKYSKERYKTIFNSTPDVIILLNKKGEILSGNKRIQDWLGYEVGDVIGKNILSFDFFPLESKKKIRDKIKDKFAGKKVDPYELEFIDKKGEKRISLVNGTIISDKNSEKFQDLVVISDITKRKLAEKALKEEKQKAEESERRLAEVTENALEWIWEVDIKGMYTYSNKSVHKILGYKPKEIIGKKYFYDFFPPEERGEMKKKALAVFGKKESFRNFINKNLHKDGSMVWFSTSGMPVLDKNGKLLGYRGMDLDITREKEIDKMKTDFVSVASHQLKTPLTGMKWTTELLENQKLGSLNEKQKELVNQVHESNDRLLDLVSDLLDVSRIETGRKFDLVKRKVALRDEIEKILKDEKLLIKKQSVKVIVNKSIDKNIRIFADQDKIRQVFHNVIVNAINYSKKGGKVEIGIKSKNNRNITFFVKDNGIGIPRKQQRRVYEKFFRGSNAIMQTNGTGLGLYIIKAIVEAHGGKTWFESSEKGTIFYLTLPINNKNSFKKLEN